MEAATAERTEQEPVPKEDDGLGPDAYPADPDGEPPTPAAELPDDDPDAEPEAEFELTIGGNRQLGLKVGGRIPDSCVLKLKGGKVELAGQFDRGDRFLTVATLQVTGDNDQDTIDKLSGEVKSTSKAQNATLCGILRLEEYLEQHLPESLTEPVFQALGLGLPEAE
jgi:hypothetical protein